MNTVRVKRQNVVYEKPVIFVKEVQSVSNNRDAFGGVYSGTSDSLMLLFKPEIDIKKGDVLLYNDFEVEISSVSNVQYKGKIFLKKALAML